MIRAVRPRVILGYDLGGTNARATLCRTNQGFSTRIQLKEGTDRRGGLAVVDQMVRMAEALKKQEGITAYDVVGVSFAGPFDSNRGVVLAAPNIDGFEGFELTRTLQEKLGAPAFGENDANCGAVSAHGIVDAAGMDDFLWVTVSSGFGAGMYVNGQLVRGHSFRAGEIGHESLYSDRSIGNFCGCGGKGHAENFAGVGLRMLFNNLNYSRESSLGAYEGCLDMNTYDAKDICEAASAGDAVCLEAVKTSANEIAHTLANYVVLMDPEAIFVSGSLGQNSLYFRLLQEAFDATPIAFRWDAKAKHDMLRLSTVEDPCLVGALVLADEKLTALEAQRA
ncbi:MAG: ROK family protein [Candidatus Margulisiibacteriota bacterium]